MKNISPLFILMLFIGFTACNPPMDKTSVLTTPKSAVNVDSLNVVFLAGWKNKDSAAIISTIADNAVVMNDSKIHTGISSIAKNWISGGVKVLSNIRTVSSIHEGRGDIAYDGGTYSLDLTLPDGTVLKEKGNYSLVWTKQNNGDWKLVLVHIEDVTRLPDIQ
jgi:ketosteroid isomerase-like protein